MRTSLKRAAAAVLAVVLATSLCGCDRGSLMTVDGMEIRNGVYISLMQSAYNNAETELKEQQETSDITSDTSAGETSSTESKESVPITKEEIDGKSGSQWIKDETMKAVRRFVAVQRKCDELGIALSETEMNELNTNVNGVWDNANDYVKYIYGYETLGEYYESQGIGKESYKEIQRVSELQSKLFMHYYDKGGELEVKESEINDYLKENYASVKLLNIAYTDASGKTLEKDEDKKAMKDKAQALVDRLNKGDDPVDVFYDYNLEKAEESAKAKAETDYKEDNEDKLTKEEWIKKQVEAAGIKKAESADDLDQFISKESSSLNDEKLTEYIFNAKSDGKATLFEAEKAVYVVVKEDIAKKTKWKEDNNERILTLIKNDDFKSMVDLFGQNYEVVADENLVNKKYGPERLNT